MANQDRIDSASRMISASAEVVYAAFADPAALVQWLPPTGMTGRVVKFDFQEGGSYRLILSYTDGSGSGKTTAEEDDSEGTFIELVPNRRIVQSVVFESDNPDFSGRMLMNWELEPLSSGVRVTVTATDVPVGFSQKIMRLACNRRWKIWRGSLNTQFADFTLR